MPKGAYKVSDNYVGPGKDGSFRSCLCAMLIFAAICGSIVLIAHLVKNSGSKKQEPNTGESLGTVDEQKGNKFHDNEVLKPVETTTKKPIKLNNITKELEAPKESSTVPNEADVSAEVLDDFVTKDPGAEFGKLQQNNDTNVITPNLTDNSDNSAEKPRTKEPVTSTVLPEGNVVSSEVVKGQISTNSSTTQQTLREQMTDKTTELPNDNNFKAIVTENITNETKGPTPTTTTKPLTTGPVEPIQAPIKQPTIATTEQPEEPTTAITEPSSEQTTIETVEKSTEQTKGKTTTEIPNDINFKAIVIENTTNETKGPTTTTTTTTEQIIVTKPLTTGPVEPTQAPIKQPIIATTEQPEEPTTAITEPSSEQTTIETVEKSPEQTKGKTTTELPNDNNFKPIVIENTTNETKGPTTTTTTTTEQIIVTKPLTTGPVEPTQAPIKQPTIATTEQPEEPTTTITEPSSRQTTIETVEKSAEQTKGKTTTELPNGNNSKAIVIHNITKETEGPSTTVAVQPTQATIKPLTTTEKPEDPTTVTTEPSSEQTTMQTEQTRTTEQSAEPSTVLKNEKTTSAPNESTTNKVTPQHDISETENGDERMSTSNPGNNKQNRCDLVCMKSVARILTRMNYEGDACEDFYDYACGGDFSDNTLEDHWRKIAAEVEKINGKSPKAHTTFKNFYEKCVDFQLSYDYTKRSNEALELISEVNKLVEVQDNDKAALTNLLTWLLQNDNSPLFDISVDVDKISQRFVFQLNIGKQYSAIMNNYATQRKCLYESKKNSFAISFFNHLNLNEIYKIYSECQKNYTYNNNVINDTLSLFSEYDFEEWELHLQNMENITELFKTFTPAQIRKDIVTKNFQYMKVAELKNNYPMVDWKLLLQNLVHQEINDEILVQVYFPAFVNKMFKILTKLSGREVRDVILEMFAFDLYTNFILPIPVANPEEFCLKQSADLMPEIASSFYLESLDSKDVEDDQKRVEDIFDTLKEKFIDLLETSEWADVLTKNAMKIKVNNTRLEMWSGSLVWQNDTLLDERMKEVDENYEKYSDFKAALNRRKQQMTLNMWKTFSYSEENIWWYFSKPYDTQPAIIYASNLVVIPAGMLFTKSNHLPRYLSLVKLGFSLGKAIGHHFDHIGSKYNISLQKSELTAYKESESCTEYYYTQETEMDYDGKTIQFKLDKDIMGLSIIERFVEQISLNLITNLLTDVEDYAISYFNNSAIAHIFTPEKLFFIAYGQEHCTKPNVDDFLLALFESEHLPPALFLNKALINSNEFSKTFDCPVGSGLNKNVQTCRAFPELEKVDDESYPSYD